MPGAGKTQYNAIQIIHDGLDFSPHCLEFGVLYNACGGTTTLGMRFHIW